MAQHDRMRQPHRFRTAAVLLMAVAMAVVPAKEGYGLIQGGQGNRPVADPGWPQGAARIFNDRERIAWWEGPPLGGGQWHAECRGNAQVLNAVLDDFLNLEVKSKRVVVHDGRGQSFWLNPNREPAKRETAQIDWAFTVWQRGSWERVRKLPPDFRPPDVSEADKELPAQIDVYVGGKIRWSDVLVPQGLEVIDERLQAHGLTAADGTVLEGDVVDLTTKKPVTARLRLERIEPRGGKYRYADVARTLADNRGRWVFKNVPEGWYRLVAEKDGFAPGVVGYARLDNQPGWHRYGIGLPRAASLTGRVTDQSGKPLADVSIQLRNVMPEGSASGYRSPSDLLCRTDADGRFQSDQAPIGRATIWLRKAGYLLPGLDPTISIPAKDLVFKMEKSGQVRVTVDFRGEKRPPAYLVEIEAEGGRAVGKWGGSGNIDQHDHFIFSDVPPGRYVITGHPNPSSSAGLDRAVPVTIDVKGGQSTEVTLFVK